MIFVIATPYQYLEMFLIVLGIVLMSQVFNKIFGIKPSQQMANQQRIREIQEEILETQNDPTEIQRLQEESMFLMKETLRKTMIPSCIRCIIFSGIFGILGFFYGGVDFLGSGYFGIYLLYSIGLSALFYYIKKLWKRFRSDEKVEEPFMDVAKALRGPRITTTPMSSINVQNRQDLIDMKQNLEIKKQRGELPSDLDIDAEIERMASENIQLEMSSNDQSISGNSKNEEKTQSKSWKKRLTEDNNTEE